MCHAVLLQHVNGQFDDDWSGSGSAHEGHGCGQHPGQILDASCPELGCGNVPERRQLFRQFVDEAEFPASHLVGWGGYQVKEGVATPIGGVRGGEGVQGARTGAG